MTATLVAPGIERRDDRGRAIAGTRITLLDVLRYRDQGWPTARIRDWFRLTDEQIATALGYIAANEEAKAAEYAEYRREGEELRRYHEAWLAEHLRAVADRPRTPEQEALRARFEEWKARRCRA